MNHTPDICRVTPAVSRPLHDVAATRQLEQLAAQGLANHTLMRRAGLSVARLALALAPHAQRIWIACGPGNNGGDGFEAATHLHHWGKDVVLTWAKAGTDDNAPADAAASRGRALAAGLQIAAQAPEHFDFCIDGLLGIGATLDSARPAGLLMQQWLDHMQASGKPRLCIDIPTGLNADTGVNTAAEAQDATKIIAGRAHGTVAAGIFTLSLLTLKPGLFTASGRDCAGQVWLDDLGMASEVAERVPPSAWLLGADGLALSASRQRPHRSHKGTFGDVAVLGGQATGRSHMAGAALLAARAALHAGAGRVFVALLGDAGPWVDTQQPELMFRSPEALDLPHQVIVCGCGGGEAVRVVLHSVLSGAPRLVLDADALNAVAQDTSLQALLRARNRRGYSTVLTPHPLEAARLAASSAADVQADRLGATARLANSFQCTVVLKGSGTVIAAPGRPLQINASGNALLATAGTGDVLAGMLGACLAGGMSDFDAACAAVAGHGALADLWQRQWPDRLLTASQLLAPSCRAGQSWSGAAHD